MLVRAEDDASAEPWADVKELNAASAKAAGSAHPAMLCLQRALENPPATPAMREVKANEWWVLQFTGTGTDGVKVPVNLIVAGKAKE